MDIRKLQRAIVDGLEDVKAQNIAVFNTEHLSSMFERVVVASGTSNRQTKALAASVRDAVRDEGFPILSTEGEDNGEWIIVDCGAAVVHIMQPGIREYYHLEEIWGEKPVKLKLAVGGTKLVKASEDEAPAEKGAKKGAKKAVTAAAKPVPAKRGGSRAEAAEKPVRKASKSAASPAAVAAKRPAAKKAAPMTLVEKKAAVKAEAQAAAKAAAKTPVKAPAKTPVKAPAKKAASVKAKTIVVGAPATRKPAAKKAVATKTAARAPAAKPAAKKAPARKTAR